MEVTDVLINLGIGVYADVFRKNGITMELMGQLDAKLIAELIPEIGPRIKFMSYWKANFFKNEIAANTSIEIDNVENNKNVNNSNEQKLQNTMQETNNSVINEENTLYRQNAFCSKDQFMLDTMPSINDLLEKSQTGRIILQVSKSKELNGSMRNKLCNIIVGYMEDNNIIMSNKIAEEISKRITKTFPSEAKGTYFIEGKRKVDTKDKKSIAARGKLWSCWRNRRYAISKLQKKIKHEAINDDIDNSSDNDVVSNEDVKESLDWLKNNQTPWEIVLQKWSITFEYRYGILIKSSDKKLNKIFEEWPLFKHPNGYEFIHYDFNKMQLSDLVLTIEKWNEFFKTITQNTSVIGKNDNFVELMEKLNLDISEDSKVTIAIQLISYMIPPKQRLKQHSSKTKQYSKASIVSSRDSMIKCVTTCGDITRIRQESNNKAKEMRTCVQPYIIVVGQLENISQSYVSIDEILYSTKSTLQALDICFKAFHVLQINYPDASKHLWMLIQKGLYKFHTQWDTSFSNTEHILKKLTANTDQNMQVDNK
ncbi:uncharacterized protein [Linepithema humile]|uniref:uncharacterized protein n=3 Tax=Linepithema humile TaxID=83485 RepID=UPI00351F41B4